MKVAVIFELASDDHWMKDVVQLPNAISQLLDGGKNATLIARPNIRQNKLKKYITLLLKGVEEPRNNEAYILSKYDKIIANETWFLDSCRFASQNFNFLVLFPWFGNFKKGSRLFKKSASAFNKVFLKSDGYFDKIVNNKPTFNQKLKDYFSYRFIDFIAIENIDTYEKLKITHQHLNKKIIYLPNCPSSLYNQVSVRIEKKNHILYVGRPDDPEKGISFLLNVWLKLTDIIGDWQLIIVGNATQELKEYWDNKFNEKLSKSSIQWLGAKDPDELVTLYDDAKIVVCTSKKESGPIILSEAALRKCAFIGTPVGEIPIALKNLEGLVNSENELMETLLNFINNEDILKEQALALYERMKDRDWEIQIKKILSSNLIV